MAWAEKRSFSVATWEDGNQKSQTTNHRKDVDQKPWETLGFQLRRSLNLVIFAEISGVAIQQYVRWFCDRSPASWPGEGTGTVRVKIFRFCAVKFEKRSEKTTQRYVRRLCRKILEKKKRFLKLIFLEIYPEFLSLNNLHFGGSPSSFSTQNRLLAKAHVSKAI